MNSTYSTYNVQFSFLQQWPLLNLPLPSSPAQNFNVQLTRTLNAVGHHRRLKRYHIPCHCSTSAGILHPNIVILSHYIVGPLFPKYQMHSLWAKITNISPRSLTGKPYALSSHTTFLKPRRHRRKSDLSMPTTTHPCQAKPLWSTLSG